MCIFCRGGGGGGAVWGLQGRELGAERKKEKERIGLPLSPSSELKDICCTQQ